MSNTVESESHPSESLHTVRHIPVGTGIQRWIIMATVADVFCSFFLLSLMQVCGLVVLNNSVFINVHVHASCCDLANSTLYF